MTASERQHGQLMHNRMMNDDDVQIDRKLLKPREVAAMLRVDSKTVTRWASSGKISSVLTPGGHHRFDAAEIRKILNGTDS